MQPLAQGASAAPSVPPAAAGSSGGGALPALPSAALAMAQAGGAAAACNRRPCSGMVGVEDERSGFGVREVVRCRWQGGLKMYEVRWYGLPDTEATLLPADLLDR